MVTGQGIVNLTIKHLKERYVYGARAAYHDPNYKGPWDCAEWATWAACQLTGKLYGCEPSNDADYPDAYTGGWARDYKQGLLLQLGVKKSIKTPGAVLLAYNDDVKHIVFSAGDGRTIGAQNHYIGIAYEPVDVIDWDYGILIPGVAY